jgi:Ran GTPase-activating protein (RanGAP) involved in mRNA processing and transport
MLQYSYLQEVELRFCDIRDKFGKIILKNIRRNKYLEIIDLRSNLLGDETSRIICEELKYAKNINIIRLEENTINYRDLNEIKSYL